MYLLCNACVVFMKIMLLWCLLCISFYDLYCKMLINYSDSEVEGYMGIPYHPNHLEVNQLRTTQDEQTAPNLQMWGCTFMQKARKIIGFRTLAKKAKQKHDSYKCSYMGIVFNVFSLPVSQLAVGGSIIWLFMNSRNLMSPNQQ